MKFFRTLLSIIENLSRDKEEFENKDSHGQAAEKAHSLINSIENAIQDHNKFAKHASNHKHSSLEYFENSSKTLKGFHEAAKMARIAQNRPETKDAATQGIHKMAHDLYHDPKFHHPEHGHILKPVLPSDLEKAVEQERKRPRLKKVASTKVVAKSPKGFISKATVMSRDDLEKAEKPKVLTRASLRSVPPKIYGATQPRFSSDDEEGMKVIPKRRSRKKKTPVA